MVHSNKIILFLVLALTLLLTACGSNQKSLQNTFWTLHSLTIGGEQFKLELDRLPTLEIGKNDEVNGYAGCNTFGGEMKINPDGSLQVSDLFQTEMWCEQGMQLESNYLSALAAGEHYRVDDGRLIITSEDGQFELVFAPAEQ